MAALANDVVVRLYLNGDWRDVSNHVRAESGVSYKRGRQPEDNTTPPQECSLTLDNGSLKGDGDYTERNPMGQWYGYLKRFTPAEAKLRVVKDTATATASNGWGSTDAHSRGAWSVEAWSTSGGAASDYAKAAGKATHLLSAAGAARITYLSNFRARDVGVKLTVSASVANVTGSSVIEGMTMGNVMLRGQGGVGGYYLLRMVVQTDETIVIDWWAHDGTSLTGGSFTATGLTYSNANTYEVRAEIEGHTLRAKVWQTGTPEPFAWTLTTTDEGDFAVTDSMRDSQGWVGVRSSLLSGNTNTNVTTSCDNIEIYSFLAAGEVPEWPQARDETGRDQTVRITICGPKRRLVASRTLARSALYNQFLVNAFGGFVPTPDAYFPLEDGAQTAVDSVMEATGGLAHLKFLESAASTTVSRITWGADSSRPGSKQSMALSGGGLVVAQLSPPTSATRWGACWQQKYNFADGSNDILGTLPSGDLPIYLVLERAAGDTVLHVSLHGGGVSLSPMMSHDMGTKEVVEQWHSVQIEAWQDGGDVAFFLYLDGEQVADHTESPFTLYGLETVELSSVSSTSGESYFGHLAVYGDLISTVSAAAIEAAALGNVAESPVYRARRVAQEYGYEFDWIGFGAITGFGPLSTLPGDGLPMGAQRVGPVIDLLNDIEKVDGGLLYEKRSASALQLRTLESMSSRSSWVTLSMGTSKHLSPPLIPVPDDKNLTNRFTATRTDGGEFVVSLDEGPMSTLPPDQGGIGLMERGDTYNVATETSLPSVASYQVARGTIDQERYPYVTVELHRPAVIDTAGLISKLRDLDIGDQVTLADLESNGIYDDRDLLVIGISGTVDQQRHTMRLVTTPAELLRVWMPGATTSAATEFARADSDFTTLDEDLTLSETDVTIEVASDRAFWVNSVSHPNNFPFDVITGGEAMRVTAGTAPAGQNQTWTVTRALNGVQKTHTAGQKISLYRPNYMGLGGIS